MMDAYVIYNLGWFSNFTLLCRHLLWLHRLEAQAAPAKFFKCVDLTDVGKIVSVCYL